MCQSLLVEKGQWTIYMNDILFFRFKYIGVMLDQRIIPIFVA